MGRYMIIKTMSENYRLNINFKLQVIQKVRFSFFLLFDSCSFFFLLLVSFCLSSNSEDKKWFCSVSVFSFFFFFTSFSSFFSLFFLNLFYYISFFLSVSFLSLFFSCFLFFIFHFFRTVVIALYQKYGMKGCLNKLRGEFAIVGWDGNSKQLFGARDR